MPTKRRLPEERILDSVKRLNLTLATLKAEMNVNAGTFDGLLGVQRLSGRLRLIIRCRHAFPGSWSMSVVLNSGRFDGRIDCIDWEPLFVSIDGIRCNGFHRHVWNPKSMSCDRFKMPLAEFRPTSAEEFIVQGLKLLNAVVP
jgi:hypothetical protein